MDPILNQIVGQQFYKDCFSAVFKNKTELNEESEARLDQCLQNQIQAYQIVNESFGNFLGSLPVFQQMKHNL